MSDRKGWFSRNEFEGVSAEDLGRAADVLVAMRDMAWRQMPGSASAWIGDILTAIDDRLSVIFEAHSRAERREADQHSDQRPLASKGAHSVYNGR